MVLLLAFGSTLCGIAGVLVAQEVLQGRLRRRSAFRRVVSYTPGAQQVQAPTDAPKRPRLSEVLVPALSRVALKLNPRAQTNELQLRLAAAGFGSRITAQHFLALKTLFGVLAIIIGFGAGGLSGFGLF